MNYTGIVIYPKGASVRPEPNTFGWSTYVLPQGSMFEFDELRVVSNNEMWARLADGWLALRYPGTIVDRADWWETGCLYRPDDLYIHLHDFEIPPYTARVNLPSWHGKRSGSTPEVFPIYTAPKKNSSGARVKVDKWEDFIKNLNPGKRKWNYLTNPHSGWFNQAGWAQLELLAMGGNVFHVIDERDGYYQVETLRADVVGSSKIITPWRTPWFVQRFNVVTKNNRIVDPSPGEIYCPLIAKYGQEAWIPTKYLRKL